MKYILCLILSCVCYTTFAQQESLFCEQISAIKELVEEHHYKPKTIDDEFSKGVFNLFLNHLDEDKDYFFEEDITILKADLNEIDNYVLDNNCNFTSKYSELLKKRYLDYNIIFEDLKSETIDYSGTITLSPISKKDYTYFKDITNLKSSLKKRVAYKTIVDYLGSKDSLNTDLGYFKIVEPALRLKVIDRELCKINELLFPENGLDTYVNNQFLDAYLKYQDPNSSFFTNEEKEVYQNDLATQKKSFGVVTQKNRNGEIVISTIIPGSSAYKNGRLEEGNILLNLKSLDSELQINCISNKDVVIFLTDEKNKNIKFTVKDKNEAIKTIILTKTEIKVTENAVTGFIINKNNLKIGYIKIPSFYTDYSSPNGRGVSSDVAKEIYKLQKEGIEGLIIDLQFNGGGSMQEAINLSGMFIDRGPLSILKFNNGETFTIRDPKRGSFFNKPMLIIQNDFSASASEFFTAAMQDYKRAIVVGEKSFGKSTAQNIMPLKEDKNIGFCKVTVELFYRVTGKTHQAKGIIPDITLPSLYKKLNNTEASREYVILDSTITPTLNHFTTKLKPLESISSESSKRVLENNYFKIISKNSQELYNVINIPSLPYKLTISNIKNKRIKRSESYKTIFYQNELKLLDVENTNATNELISYNNEEKEENELIIDELTKDIYINESYNILIDYINLN